MSGAELINIQLLYMDYSNEPYPVYCHMLIYELYKIIDSIYENKSGKQMDLCISSFFYKITFLFLFPFSLAY